MLQLYLSHDLYNIVLKIEHNLYERGPKNFRKLKKKYIFKIFIRFRKFISLQNSPAVTVCSDPIAAPNAGNLFTNSIEQSPS